MFAFLTVLNITQYEEVNGMNQLLAHLMAKAAKNDAETALDAGTAIESPGTVIDTAIKWSNDPSWKERASSGLNNGVVSSEGDTRSDRTDIPQYQSEEDREAAEA